MALSAQISTQCIGSTNHSDVFEGNVTPCTNNADNQNKKSSDRRFCDDITERNTNLLETSLIPDSELYAKLCINFDVVRKVLRDFLPKARMENDVAMIMSFAIDDFLCSIGSNCYKLASHRGSSQLELLDLHTSLAIEWRMPSGSLPPVPFESPERPSDHFFSYAASKVSSHRQYISIQAEKTRQLMNKILDQQTKLVHGDQIPTSRHRVKNSRGTNVSRTTDALKNQNVQFSPRHPEALPLIDPAVETDRCTPINPVNLNESTLNSVSNDSSFSKLKI